MNCSLCQRDTPDKYLEKHHLIPRCKKGKETIPVCCDCGNQVHNLFTVKELRDKYNTVGALLSDERVKAWIRWIQEKKSFGMCMKEKKHR